MEKSTQTLKEWLDGIGAQLSESEENKLFLLMDDKIIKEFSLHGDDWVSWKSFGKHQYVTSWILLESGYAVGWNENPGTGWSFPSQRVPEIFETHRPKMKDLILQILMEKTQTEGRYIGGGDEPQIVSFLHSEDWDREPYLEVVAKEIAEEIEMKK